MSNTSTSAEMSEENYFATIRVGSVCCYVTLSFPYIGEGALGGKEKMGCLLLLSLCLSQWKHRVMLCYCKSNFNFKLTCGRCDLLLAFFIK